MNITSYIGIGISLLVMGFNCAMFIILKFNDMVHLGHDVKEIKDDVKTLVLNSQKLEIRMAEQETKCRIMHKRIRRNRTQE
jgi:hypothetical protein